MGWDQQHWVKSEHTHTHATALRSNCSRFSETMTASGAEEFIGKAQPVWNYGELDRTGGLDLARGNCDFDEG